MRNGAVTSGRKNMIKTTVTCLSCRTRWRQVSWVRYNPSCFSEKAGAWHTRTRPIWTHLTVVPVVSGIFIVSGASAASRWALDGSGCFGGPARGQQFAEAAVGPVIDELSQHIGQVSMRIDAMQLAGFDQRGEHRPVF